MVVACVAAITVKVLALILRCAVLLAGVALNGSLHLLSIDVSLSTFFCVGGSRLTSERLARVGLAATLSLASVTSFAARTLGK